MSNEAIPAGTQVVHEAHVVFERGPNETWTCRVLLSGNPAFVYAPDGTHASDADAAVAVAVTASFAEDEYPIFWGS